VADPFVHLHVASGYSLQYGASHPHVLVERAAEQEMDTLALTDRDGTYGAVRFVKAAMAAGIRPVLGVDLAFDDPCFGSPVLGSPSSGRPQAAPRTPTRGGASRDRRLPRVTFLASGKAGWAAVCRLVSATHHVDQGRKERGSPVCTPELVAEHVAGRDVRVLLGPASDLGRAATLRRDDLGGAVLRRWLDLVGPEQLVVEVVSHRLPGSGPGSSPHAARMAGLAHTGGRRGSGSARVRTVLSNAVRFADRLDAPTVDVLDATRRLVPMDVRHLDRSNAEGFLKSGKQMHEVAEEICRFAGLGEHGSRGATELLASTRAVADQCVLDPRADLGIGEVHFPEFEVVSTGTGPTSPVTTVGATPADRELRARCEAAIGRRYGNAPRQRIWKRLDDELATIGQLGFASYFLTVGEVTEMIRTLGIRTAARGSGAGSLVNYLLGISGVDPLRHHLLMERFLSPLRQSLPDIDIDVESARRLEVYDAILDRFGTDRCATVSMMDTYKVRHAIRDVGAALGMPMGEIDAIAKAFPHIRARDARLALRDLPELRSTGMAREAAAGEWGSFDLFFRLVESLDGLPRHIAMHPCGVLLSDRTLLDRTPVEQSFLGYPMSQFDKDDVEDLGLLKLDVLGIRMQSAMAHAVGEIERTSGRVIDLDDEVQVPFDDPTTYSMISSAKTLGVFQIESPGQRELVGKSGIETFSDIITDISLFRPGPVKSDMITPYLEVKHGWKEVAYLHDDLRPILETTRGVVVFHEQVIEMIAQFTGCTYAEADEARRALGDQDGMTEVRTWFFPRALGRGYPLPVVEQIWKVVEAFASFGFCKAHAAAFALPTYQSAWLKAHYPAHFIAGVLTHDPGMYPKRLILDDARQLGIAVLGLDVNASQATYVVEQLADTTPVLAPDQVAAGVGRFLPRGGIYTKLPAPVKSPESAWMGHGWGIRIALEEVRGINDAEVDRIVQSREGAPYASLTDFWQRAQVSRPVVERLVQAGAFDSVYGIGVSGAGRRNRVTRRDLLLEVSDLDRLRRASDRAQAKRARGLPRSPRPGGDREASFQLTLDLGETSKGAPSGLPEMTDADRVRAELDILGLDASKHVIDFHAEFLDRLGITRSADLLSARSRSELLVAGVKVATQTPPIRSGRRVVFLTLDDGTGPVDATFFENVQGPYAATVFGSWLLVVRGELRRTGHRRVGPRGAERPVARGGDGRRARRARPGARGLRRSHRDVRDQPGDGAHQRVPDVAVRRHRPGRRLTGHRDRRGGAQALAPQPGERGMNPTHRLGWRPWTVPSNAAPPPAPRWSGTPSVPCSRGGRTSRSSTSAAAPAASRSGSRPWVTGSPWSTPVPTPSPRWRAVPTSRVWPTGSPVSRATWAPCAPWHPRTVPTSCCATVCSVWSRTPTPRCARSRRCCGRTERSPCWSASVTQPCSPGRWRATSARRCACSTGRSSVPWGTTDLPSTGSPSSSSLPCSREPGSTSAAVTASGSSPTWFLPRCSTSNQVPLRPSWSWSGPSPSARSTSPSPASCTSSPPARSGGPGGSRDGEAAR
jgi:error-prone DNA polymerase